MKRLMLAASVLLVGASLSYGSGLSGFVSQWDPDEKGLDSTTGGGAKLTLGDTIALELRASYYDDDILTIIPADVGLALSLPLGGPISLYADGGATWYFLDSDLGDVDDEAGWYAGGGVEIKLGEALALFAEAQYRSLDYTAPNDKADDLEKHDGSIKALTYAAGLTLKF